MHLARSLQVSIRSNLDQIHLFIREGTKSATGTSPIQVRT